MYSSSGIGSAGRIYNPRPDPAERGPPKRVNREEAHIGTHVASSKRRIAWTFTLGDSDTIHEAVLVHSIMSYKKVVEFDGRQMHFSSTATPGDWNYVMVYDGTNCAIEIRINDLESEEIPKYDLVIDRVPFRRWDVYRRRKNQPGSSNSYGQNSTQPAPASGAHRWGPGGMTAPPPMDAQSATAHQVRSRTGSFNRDGGSNYQAPQQQKPQQQQQQTHAPQRGTAAPPAKRPQQEINLIGDYGPDVSVPAQQLLFDPLASSKMGVTPPLAQPSAQGALRTASNPTMTPGYGQSGNARTASNPAMTGFSAPPAPQPYVDPFANVAQPLPIKPSTATMNLDPFASGNSSYMQQNRPVQQQAAPMGAPTYPMATPSYQQHQQYQQQPMMPMGQPRGVPGMAMPSQQQGFPGVSAGPPAYPSKGGAVNYNISHLMNPMEVNSVRNPQQTKNINIDPFAGMKTK